MNEGFDWIWLFVKYNLIGLYLNKERKIKVIYWKCIILGEFVVEVVFWLSNI